MQLSSLLTTVLQFLYNSIYTAIEVFKAYSIEIILSTIVLLFTVFIFYVFTFNPYDILKSFTTLFIITYVITIALTISIFSSNDKNKTKLIIKFLKLVSVIAVAYIGFRLLLSTSSNAFVFIGKESPISAIIMMIALMAVLYKSFVQKRRNQSTSKTLNFILDVLFYVPCLLLDLLEHVKTNISGLPESSILIIAGIAAYLSYKYILPSIKGIFSRKDRIQLLSHPKELSREILSVDQNKIRESIIETRPFLQRKTLEVTNRIEKLIQDQGEFFKVSDELFNMNNIYGNKQVVSNAGVLSRLKYYKHCENSDNIECDNSSNVLMCDGKNVIDYYGMNVPCSGGKTSLTSDPINNVLVYNSEDKTRQVSLSNLCKFDVDLSNVSTGVGCYEYNSIVDDVMNPNPELSGNHVYCCNVLGESVGSNTGSKYKVIYAFNDTSDTSSVLLCKTEENITEGFENKYFNPKLHALDVHFEKHNYIGIFSKEEQEIIKSALDDDKNILNEALSMYAKDPDLAKAYIISQLSNNKHYMSFLQHVNEYNLKSRRYLNQEISEFIKFYHMKNNISSYNYYYGISFWIYFDTSILNHHRNVSEGLIMDYDKQPRIVYDYENQQIVAKIKNCELNKTFNGDCMDEVVYKSDKILFQKWNNFVINYNYGTLDIFVNNNLVCSVPGVSPYINPDNYSIIFGSETNPLPNCAICNIEYFEYPLDLKKIKNNYKKKDNPC